ncbi:hypothetical protein Tco_1078087 [Tanacetum coccineum]
MPNNVKTYDGTGDLEDHVKNFQAAARVERCAMPTWCHMFNSTIIGAARVWFDELPSESIDGYKDLKAAFLAYFMQQNKRMKGAPECMRISGFMHRVNNPELTKRLNEHVPKTMEEMMSPPLLSYEEKPPLLAKRKVTHYEGHKTSQSGTLQSGGLTSEVSQGKDGGLTGLPPYKNTQGNPHGRSRKVQTATTYGNPGREEKQQQVLRLPVTIGDAVHSTKAWMNFMIVRSLSPYNGIIGRPRIREIQAVPSTAHGMLKFPVNGRIVTIRNTILIPAECATVITSSKEIPKEAGVRHENFNVAPHPNFPD